MKTIQPTSGMTLTEDTRFEPGIYILEAGITLAADSITLDGAGAHLIGVNHQGVGVHLAGVRDAAIKNLEISGFHHGIRAADCQNLLVKHCRINDTAECLPNNEDLDIWREPNQAYGAAILLEGVSKSQVIGNDLQHQLNGLLMYYCSELKVEGNNAGHNTGYGFFLFDTSKSTFIGNSADHCGRFSANYGKQGQSDPNSAGFLLLHHANRNVFTQNSSRLNTNGFLILGITPQMEALPCDGNIFEECDGSYCLNAAFKATGSSGIVFKGNQASHATFGFWLSYCRDLEITGNTMQGNHRAGIASENGVHCRLENNIVQDNHFGVLLWSRPDSALLNRLPNNETSKLWAIEGNTIHRNHTGLRIAANQDQGFLPLKTMETGHLETYLRPHDHEIRRNDISGNRIGVQTLHCDRTVIQDNSFSLNLSGDIKS
jgi:parallel beta-helix repeat protein